MVLPRVRHWRAARRNEEISNDDEIKMTDDIIEIPPAVWEGFKKRRLECDEKLIAEARKQVAALPFVDEEERGRHLAEWIEFIRSTTAFQFAHGGRLPFETLN